MSADLTAKEREQLIAANPSIRAFVQARMSSRRFPGKVLAPLHGRPLIDHVVSKIAKALPLQQIVVATSVERSDDPLAAYLGGSGVSIFRGPLDDVFGRFRQCLAAHPCQWFFRICADSPLLDPELFGRLLEAATDGVDVVSNVFPRTFPKGQSLELINAGTFRAIAADALSPAQREHVTKVFYDDPRRFRIVNVSSGDPSLAAKSVVVDTLEDLLALECRDQHHLVV